jgi:hypothetical protein
VKDHSHVGREGGVACGHRTAEVPPIAQANITSWSQRAVALRDPLIEADDRSDLEALSRAIGDAKVVILGEATHADGTTCLAKASVIRYLHDTKGFDVLAWESGMFECSRMDAAYSTRTFPPQMLQVSVSSTFGLTVPRCRGRAYVGGPATCQDTNGRHGPSDSQSHAPWASSMAR